MLELTPIGSKKVEDSLVINADGLVEYRGLLEPDPACFVAGTLVHTKDGLKPIEQIKVGDYVLSKPDSGVGEQEYKRVTKTLVREAQEVWLVQYGSRDASGEMMIRALVVTGNHPFWEDRDQKWTPVSDLQAYACFVSPNNDDVPFFRALKILETDIPDVGCAIADNNGCEGPTVDLRNGKVYVNQPHEDGGVDFGNWIKRQVFNLAACRTCVTNASESLCCCIEDGSRPPEADLQELASNHPVLLRSKGVVVSDCGKGIVKMSGTC